METNKKKITDHLQDQGALILQMICYFLLICFH